MKNILPKLLAIAFAVIAAFSSVTAVYAQPLPTPDVAYTPDAEVNFVGKAAARSIQFLNWTLQNYTWQCFDLKDVTNASDSTTVQACDNSASPLIGFWSIIRNIVYAFFALFVLITAFVLITTRGRSLTIKRFLPRFIAVVLLVTFSYALLQFLYITTDIIQGFFLTKPPETPGAGREIISAKDLLYVGWDYENFVGLRKIHPYFDESVFVNLLLARLTAVTYYAMTGVLLIRKIILWFFIIVSPIFPVLLLYYPVRNTAKIWIGEFFRWLMYAPLFSVFLAGLVSLWKAGIPLLFHGFSDALSGKIIYPTATNILLGGPGQQVSINNNLNVPETFAQYVVALIMLWVVILLPFVLLQIFLDYLNNFSFSESPAFQKIMNTSYSLLNKTPPPVPIGPGPSGPDSTTGVARALPFARFGMAKQIPNIQDTGQAKELPFSSPIARTMAAQVNTEMLGAANIALPTIRDIVNYETAALRQDPRSISNTYNALQKIANPQSIGNPIEREKFVTIKDRLTKESLNGNSLANAVLSAVTVVNNISTVNQTSNLKNNLTNIANPASSNVTSKERERITKLHDSLVKESQQGSTLATTLLSTNKETTTSQIQNMREQLLKESMNNNVTATNVLATSMSKVESESLQQVISQIANPQTASVADRERITQLHDSLVKESEKGNEVATTILNSKEITSTSQLEEIKEKLIDASLQGNQAASSVISTAITQSSVKSTQQVLQQIANPTAVTNTVEREHFVKMKEKLTQAQAQGNQLAGEVLTVAATQMQTDKPEAVKQQEVQAIKDKLIKAKDQGDNVAADVLQMFNKDVTTATPVNTSLPQSNRVQSVSFEDYEAVKKMWQENYNNLEAPEGVNRAQWIKSEVKDIDGIVAMLSSTDEQQVQEGMQQVSNILPFLMLGGFSKEEIVGYLKAKQEAGKSVLEVIEKEEEDTMVTVEKRTTSRSATMAQSQAIDINSSSSDDDADEVSPLQQVVNKQVNIKVSDELLKLTNLPLPTMRDVVKFEVSLLSKDATNKADIVKVKDTLSQIANPAAITSETDRTRVQQIKDTLMQNSQQGDVLATSILNAANNITQMANANVTQGTNIQQVVQQLANPATVASQQQQERITKLKESLAQAGQQGNPLASSILGAVDQVEKTGSLPAEQEQQLQQQLLDAKQNNDPLAASLFDVTNEPQTVGLPESNRIQTVSLEDYDAVREMWEENYKSLDIPAGVNDRKQWIEGESQNIERIISLLTSADEQQKQQGMQEVSNLLPFLLLGGFSQEEIVAYLKAKREAGKSVLKQIESDQNNEETMVTVNMQATPVPAAMSQSVSQETEIDEGDTPPAAVAAPIANTSLLQSVNVTLPTLRDLVKYEISLQAKEDIQKQEAMHVRETLGMIVNPEKLTNTEEKEKAQGLKTMLEQASGQGDAMADAILKASHYAYHGVDEQLSETLLLTLRQYMEEIAQPGDRLGETKEEVRKEILALHDEVVQASQQGDPLAVNILTINSETPLETVGQIWEQMITAKMVGNVLAGKILGVLPEDLRQKADKVLQTPTLPETNKIQTINLDDYEAVRAMWEDNYAKAELPNGETDRAVWITKEIDRMQQTLGSLSSGEPAQVQIGMQQVSHILPFLLLGGFSLSETTTYLKAKLQAAQSVGKTLITDQQREVLVSTQTSQPAQEMAMPLSQDAGVTLQTPGGQQNT